MEINWDELTSAAIAALENSYAPYSKFPVGVAALTDRGDVITGANVENASYGLGLCAECSFIWPGDSKFGLFKCFTGDTEPYPASRIISIA